MSHHPASSTLRIFATADIGANAIEMLRQKGYDVEVYPRIEAPSHEEIVAQVRSGITALITTLRDRIDEEVFAAGAGTLRVVAQDSVGVDNIDRTAANRYRIPFTHTPEVLTEATAEFAFFMMGAVARKLWSSEELVRSNQWGTWHPWHPFLGDEVTGKTVAVIGVGRIGRAFAAKCVALDMDILCCSHRRPDEQLAHAIQQEMNLRFQSGLSRRQARIRFVDLRTALNESDFVSLHVPLIRPGQGEHPTWRMINEETLGWMKPTAYLINTARGPVIDEEALVRALKENRLAGAALDVFEVEPLPTGSPLRDPALRDRLRLFHHFGSGTRETRLDLDPARGMAGRCVQALLNVLENNYDGDPARMPFVVNKEAFVSPAAPGAR